MKELVSDLHSPGKVTLNNLVAILREGFDILCLVCHGALLTKKDPPGSYLWLEESDGTSALVSGIELAERVRAIQEHRPRLVVLASCQSAGQGTEARSADSHGALVSLGPRLAESGVPAVIAMLGSITMETVAILMPTFFRELLQDGQIDRALAAARAAVSNRPDSWMPVLFLRLRSGSIWYTPSFAGEQATAEKWPAIVDNIHWQSCTPILGSGLRDSLLGSQREIAQRWSETYHYPMDPHDREDLPQVAQYLAVRQQFNFPHRQLMEHLRTELLTRYQSSIPESLRASPGTPDNLNQIMKSAWIEECRMNPYEPNDVLAALPFRIYITTNPDDLLEEALRAHNKNPKTVVCPWKPKLESLAAAQLDERAFQPSTETPLVYHLFGHITVPGSIVLTEDDYFDYLIGITGNRDLVPGTVREALANTALLFCGFRLDEWDFRVLLRSIVTQQSLKMLNQYTHIGVQIDPDEGRHLEPERARRYLESYFQKDANINIYWGSVGDFVKELQIHCKARLAMP